MVKEKAGYYRHICSDPKSQRSHIPVREMAGSIARLSAQLQVTRSGMVREGTMYNTVYRSNKFRTVRRSPETYDQSSAGLCP